MKETPDVAMVEDAYTIAVCGQFLQEGTVVNWDALKVVNHLWKNRLNFYGGDVMMDGCEMNRVCIFDS